MDVLLECFNSANNAGNYIIITYFLLCLPMIILTHESIFITLLDHSVGWKVCT